jgi:threonine synthase
MPGRCERESQQDLCSRNGRGFFVAHEAKETKLGLEALSCKECGTSYPLEARYVCERCFGPLEAAYDLSGLDPAETKRRIQAGSRGIWRYADFLPFDGRPRDPLEPGLTPLVRADRLAERLGLGEVWVKNDTANPTHSFKDRVVAVALAKARELGFDTVACASTGNLANAVAAHAAAAGLRSYVFVPADLEEQKLLATGVYGTTLVGVRGTYDDVNRLCTELSETRGWAFVNVNLRPYYAEGSKTLAYETVEQLGWELPDRVVCPIASGSLFSKIGRGFGEWLDLGLVDGELPAFNGAQPAGCSPVATAFADGHEICRPVRPDTIAKSLAIGNPADGPYALELARKTGGSVEAVSDDEIRDGIRLLAETTGIFTETAGGVTTAVLAKLADASAIDQGEQVVLYITGEGLKTLDATRDTFTMHEIEPTLESFESAEGVEAPPAVAESAGAARK